MAESIVFLVALFLVAFMYSMVGHGGASGYLAVMSIFAVDLVWFRSAALVLNLFVAGIAFINFRTGFSVRWRLFLPFLLPAIPMAFLGALIRIDPTVYRAILGGLLLLAVFRLLYRPSQEYTVKEPPALGVSVVIGILLGLISGVIGIGGGILLSPFFILMRWSAVRETGVYSSLFILCNSLAGLAGLTFTGLHLPPGFSFWVAAVTAGGLAGSLTAMKILPVKYFRLSLAVVLLFACYKLLFA